MGGFDTFWGFFDPGSGRWWLGLVSRTAVCFPKCLILECKTEPKAGLVSRKGQPGAVVPWQWLLRSCPSSGFLSRRQQRCDTDVRGNGSSAFWGMIFYVNSLSNNGVPTLQLTIRSSFFPQLCWALWAGAPFPKFPALLVLSCWSCSVWNQLFGPAGALMSQLRSQIHLCSAESCAGIPDCFGFEGNLKPI